MLRKVKLEIVTEQCYYNQISQTSEIQWSWLNRVQGEKDSFKELHLQVKCREYFGDAVVCAHLDIDMPDVYGFKLINKRLALNETLLSVSLPTTAIPDFANKMKFLRSIEKRMGISMTKVYPTQHSDKLVLVGDKKWVSSPLLVSIYSIIIRSLTYTSTAKTYKDHIKELITGIFSSSNDASAFKTFKNDKVDLLHLLLNIDKVTGTNPLTGLNDAMLIAKKHTIIDQYNSIALAFDEGTFYNWKLANNHAQHGIIRFLNTVEYLNQGNSYQTIGAGWAKNYIEVLKSNQDSKEEELNMVLHNVPTPSHS